VDGDGSEKLESTGEGTGCPFHLTQTDVRKQSRQHPRRIVKHSTLSSDGQQRQPRVAQATD